MSVEIIIRPMDQRDRKFGGQPLEGGAVADEIELRRDTAYIEGIIRIEIARTLTAEEWRAVHAMLCTRIPHVREAR